MGISLRLIAGGVTPKCDNAKRESLRYRKAFSGETLP